MTKVSVVQMKADVDKEKNLTKILSYISQAASRGSTLCAVPDFIMCDTRSSQSASELADIAENITGKFVSSIGETAKENSIEVVGTFYEKSPQRHRVYDTSFLINKNGKIISRYRKIHLYDALGFKESMKLYPGSSIAKPVKTSIGK